MKNQDGFKWVYYRCKNYDYLQLRVLTRFYLASCNRNLKTGKSQEFPPIATFPFDSILSLVIFVRTQTWR